VGTLKAVGKISKMDVKFKEVMEEETHGLHSAHSSTTVKLFSSGQYVNCTSPPSQVAINGALAAAVAFFSAEQTTKMLVVISWYSK
jgi:hypothetical protein